ncbi:hypothetical protein LFM09_01915 [Lentzea alba]
MPGASWPWWSPPSNGEGGRCTFATYGDVDIGDCPTKKLWATGETDVLRY